MCFHLNIPPAFFYIIPLFGKHENRKFINSALSQSAVLLVTLPKDYINISGNGTKLPFIIPAVRKIFPLCISQFNKPVFFSIEGFHGRQFISGRFFFQCPESCIIKRKLCPVFFVEFILIAALTIVGIYVFVCKILSGKMYLLIHIFKLLFCIL